MRNPIAKIGVAVALCALAVTVAKAQTVPGSLQLRWTLPTTVCTVGVTPCDNKPATGADALTAVHVWISTSPIVPDATVGNGLPTAAPTLTLAAGVTTATHTMQVTAGQTLYARIAVRNQYTNSALSTQVTKLITVASTPNVPTNVTIELTIGT